MIKKAIIAAIFLITALMALMPFSFLNADVLASYSSDTIYNGNFEMDTINSTDSKGWENTLNPDEGYIKVVSDDYGNAIEICSGIENSTNDSRISQYYIPVTTPDQVLNFDVKPISPFSDIDLFIGWGVQYYDAEYNNVGAMECWFKPKDLSAGSWESFSFNITPSDNEYVYETYSGFISGKSISDIAYIKVWFDTWSYSYSIATTARFDNISLSGASSGSKPLTPEEWVGLDLNVQQLRDH